MSTRSLAMSVVVALLAVGLATAPAIAAPQARRPGATQTRPAAPPAKSAVTKPSTVTAEFVSGDAKAHTVTVKDEKGKTMTLKLEGKATTELSSFKPGNKVVLTCRDDAKGEHQAVTEIAMAPANAPAQRSGL